MDCSEENSGTKSFLIRDLLSDLIVKNDGNNKEQLDDNCDGKNCNFLLKFVLL
jgi:hypothetical protein